MTFSPVGSGGGQQDGRCSTKLGFAAWVQYICAACNCDNLGRLHHAAEIGQKYLDGSATTAEHAQLKLEHTRACEHSEGGQSVGRPHLNPSRSLLG